MTEFDDKVPFLFEVFHDGFMVKDGTGVNNGVETDETENLMHGHNGAPLGFYDVEEAGISEVINASYRHTPEITERTNIGLVGDVA